MTDPKAGMTDITKKVPRHNFLYELLRRNLPSRFQRNVDIKIKVSEYNQKPGKLKL